MGSDVGVDDVKPPLPPVGAMRVIDGRLIFSERRAGGSEVYWDVTETLGLDGAIEVDLDLSQGKER